MFFKLCHLVVSDSTDMHWVLYSLWFDDKNQSNETKLDFQELILLSLCEAADGKVDSEVSYTYKCL